MRVFVVHPPPPLADRVLFVDFSHFFMDRSGGRVAQSCQYFQKFVNHCHNKILLIKPLLLLNQDVVGDVGIQPYQIKYIKIIGIQMCLHQRE